LLRRVSGRVLGIRDTGSAAEDRARGRSDTGAAAAADCSADRGAEPGAKKGAAEGLSIRLALQRGDLLAGILPAGLIIVIGLRRRAGARRQHRQGRGDAARLHRVHQILLRNLESITVLLGR
jgi:hypothetical protein